MTVPVNIYIQNSAAVPLPVPGILVHVYDADGINLISGSETNADGCAGFLLEGSGRFWRRHSSALPAGGFWKGQWGFIPGRFFGGGDDIDDDFGWSYSSSTPSPSGDIAVALPVLRHVVTTL